MSNIDDTVPGRPRARSRRQQRARAIRTAERRLAWLEARIALKERQGRPADKDAAEASGLRFLIGEARERQDAVKEG